MKKETVLWTIVKEIVSPQGSRFFKHSSREPKPHAKLGYEEHPKRSQERS